MLEYLHVKFVRIQACAGIIQDGDGKPVVYPRLQTLILDVLGAYDDDELRFRELPRGAPFPSIRTLVCKYAYPFANNVLLRGCQTTLETLVLAVDPQTAGWLFPDSSSSYELRYPLSQYAQLSTLEIQVITRSGSSDERIRELDGQILNGAFNAPHLNRLRISYPNTRSMLYKNHKRTMC
ncbi:hypothetical protein GGI12_003831 [Dipsacomyces acuminosporus]|nr:hypothetical protein GGI12_003831 [Dipsacomyces acuminosporus]